MNWPKPSKRAAFLQKEKAVTSKKPRHHFQKEILLPNILKVVFDKENVIDLYYIAKEAGISETDHSQM